MVCLFFASSLDQAGPSHVGLPDIGELARRNGVTHLSVEGFVSRPVGGAVQLGSLTLELPPQAGRAVALESDTRVWVQGRSDANALHAACIALPPPRMRPPVAPPLPILRDSSRPAPLGPTDLENGRSGLRRGPIPGSLPHPAPARQPRPEPGEGPARIEPDVDRLQPVPGDARGLLTR